MGKTKMKKEERERETRQAVNEKPEEEAAREEKDKKEKDKKEKDKKEKEKKEKDKRKMDEAERDKKKREKKEKNKDEEKKKKKKEPRRKPKYGMFSCVAYIYKLLWNTERSLVFVGFFTVPFTLGMAALGLYTAPLVVRGLEEAGAFSTVSLIILGLMLSQLILSLGDNWLREKIRNAEHYVVMELMYILKEKGLNMDYYLSFEPEVCTLDLRASAAVENNHTAAVHFPMDFAEMVSIFLKFLLFGTVISMLSPWIILLLAVGCVLNYFAARWKEKRNLPTYDARWEIQKKLNYMAFSVARDASLAKDVRLYHFQDYLSLLGRKLMGEFRTETEKVVGRDFLVAFLSFVIVLVRDGAAYLFLISKVVAGEMDAASFLLYFNAITSLSEVISSILDKWVGIFSGAMGVSDFRAFLDVEGKLNRGEGIPLPKGAISIEFRNVSYRYPEGEGNVLEDISFKVKPGEKIALVGLNGAGKTTLVRLMCGLLIPTQGEVLIDGHSVFEYNREELYSLFGLVPQDYHLLPKSIARNIACNKEGEEVDETRLWQCILLAGLEEKVNGLPRKAETLLNRQVNQEAVELSGGEIQKLLLARLLYRRPKCMILDEPTAALDPIAEDRMYRRYNEITDGATSVFISHRLASTRFCDRIILLDGAKFAESGTHEELMAAGKKYKELFDMQSRYYKEGFDGLSEMEAAL